MSLKIVLCVAITILVLSTAVIAIGPIDCPKANEHYECGSACQTECATLGEPCQIVNIRCNDACYCDDGFARNAKGTCIPISHCPPKRGKKPHTY